MNRRPSLALVVAILALVVSLTGTSYAVTQITSAQIKNNTIKSKDVKDNQLTGKDVRDGSLTGADIADGSLTKADLPADGCAADQFRLATGCLIKAVRPGGATTLSTALTDCNSLGGRLPTLNETKLLPLSNALASGVTWADGMLNQYEFTGQFERNGGSADVVATDFGGNLLADSGATPHYHHCVVDPAQGVSLLLACYATFRSRSGRVVGARWGPSTFSHLRLARSVRNAARYGAE